MFMETIRSEGLAHLSYLLGDGGEAVVIDPRRDCQVYEDLARRNGARITHIIETHRNEDYVIGSCELAERTGATILHGEGLDWGYGETVEDGHTVTLGNLQLRILATPGHTFESISIAASDCQFAEEPFGVFTGDALFVGDVGRTDLVPKDRHREAAGALYDSIMKKLMALGDHVLVFPAHGAGSVCGSGMADREVSTLGYERTHNPALLVESREAFIEEKLAEKHHRPPYFRKMEEYNQQGPPNLSQVSRPKAATPSQFAEAMEDGMLVVDTRPAEAWLGAAIEGSLSLPLGLLPAFAGWSLSYDTAVGLVVDKPNDVEEATRLLLRLGFDKVELFLDGGLAAWASHDLPFVSTPAVDADHVEDVLDSNVLRLDVRSDEEREEEHIEGTTHMYAGHIPERYEQLPRGCPVVVFCTTGMRATVAASMLRRVGFHDVHVWLGSVKSWKAGGRPTVS